MNHEEFKQWWKSEGQHIQDLHTRLAELHKRRHLIHGDHKGEYNEQIMSLQFIKPTSKVLEIGGDVGRNSVTISSLLDDSSNHVVFEASPASAKKLEENLRANQLNTRVEACAISRRPLIQKGWDTIVVTQEQYDQTPYQPEVSLLPPYPPTRVPLITLEQIREKYPIQFDTLVADCEGALYYILLDEPTFLNNIKTILLENDFYNPEHKAYVNQVFMQNGFKRIYKDTLPGNYYVETCFSHSKDCFFEAWIRE